jgi:hypothetical protein
VEEKGQEARRRRVGDMRQHRRHPDGGPKPDDRNPPRSTRKKRRVAYTRTKQRRAHWRVGTTRRSPATDRARSSGGRGGRRRRPRLGGVCQSEMGEEEQIWLPKFEEKRCKNGPKNIPPTTWTLGQSPKKDNLRWEILPKQKKANK